MTKEQKDLLFKDLGARLLYKVKCEVYDRIGILDEISSYGAAVNYDNGEDTTCEIEYVKPYLFPLSSMSEEQKEEYRKACELDTEILSKHPMDGTPFPVLYNSQDWLNAHHFDYRGLIPMGLAIDATELNIY